MAKVGARGLLDPWGNSQASMVRDDEDNNENDESEN